MSQFNQLSQHIGIAIHKATRQEKKRCLKVHGDSPTADEVMDNLLAYPLAKPMKALVQHSLDSIDDAELLQEIENEKELV